MSAVPPLPHLLLGPAQASPAGLLRPILHHRATCGFPSPAEDHMGRDLDLNEHLIRNPLATFFVQAEGHSMEGLGIQPGDILVVDRSLTPKDGHIVMVLWEDGYTVKKLRIKRRRFELQSGNDEHPTILVPEDMELNVWGVVLWSITRHA